MDKPIYLGFAVLELSKLHMFETYYDILQPYFGEKNLHLHYMDTDSFILSVTTKDITIDLKNLEDTFDFSNLDQNHETFSNKNKKVIGKFKIETPKNIWIDEFVCLRSKKYSFKCGDDYKNKLKGVSKSQSKHIIFLCEIYILRSVNHEMYLQQIKESTLSVFDDKRYYIKETERKPWN